MLALILKWHPIIKICNITLTKTTIKKQNVWILLPLFGVLLFACLYIVATFFYPGGSQVDGNSKGFSWINNYWCNLLNENAMNGQYNPARPIAMAAMFVLCLTLVNFWYIFPRQIEFNKSSRLTIQLSGAVAMTVGIFLFTDLHDIIVNVASLFGLVATVGTFIGLHKLKWVKLFWLGIFNLILIVISVAL